MCLSFSHTLATKFYKWLPFLDLVLHCGIGRSARNLSSSASSQNLAGSIHSNKKDGVCLTPTLSLKSINFKAQQTEIVPHGEVVVCDNDVATMSTSGSSPEQALVNAAQSPLAEPPGSGIPGLWLGSKRSQGGWWQLLALYLPCSLYLHTLYCLVHKIPFESCYLDALL